MEYHMALILKTKDGVKITHTCIDYTQAKNGTISFLILCPRQAQLFLKRNIYITYDIIKYLVSLSLSLYLSLSLIDSKKEQGPSLYSK